MHLHGLAVLAAVLGVQLIITLSAILWHHMNLDAAEAQPQPPLADSSPVDGTVLSTGQEKGTLGEV